ncbi:MAG: peptidyl-prolyl cis-trans isomerase [Proteobacteria bacterium]|nr:peptidyl-prolyl cis-trans isomerase [Pseudomonadota bacterium]
MALSTLKNNKVMTWLMRGMMFFLVFSFAIWGIEDVFRGFRAQDLATVGRISVSSEAYREDLMRELNRVAQTTGKVVSLEEARRMGLDQIIFDRIVNGAVVDDRVERLGLAMSHDQIVAEVMASPAFQDTSGAFNRSRFNNVLAQNGLTEQAFLAAEENNRLRLAVTDLASQDVVLPRAVTTALLRYRDETRDARYFTLTIDPSEVPPPTDDELKKQYDETPAAYTAPEYRSIVVLKVEPLDIAAKLSVSEEELKDGYERDKADYFTPELRSVLQLSFPDRAKADEAKRKLDGGADFIAVAAEYGAKPSDITFADRKKTDFLDSKLADAVFSLPEGTVSAPIEGNLSLSIVKVTKISPEHQATLEEVKDQLTRRLQEERAREEIQSVYEAVEDARASDTRFEDIAAKAGIPVIIVPAVSAAGFDKSGKPVTLPDRDEVLKRVFESDVGLQEDAIAGRDNYIWYEVREIIPSALRPFDEVKDQVRTDVTAEKLAGALAAKAKALVEKAGTTTKLETLASESNAQVKTIAGVKRVNITEDFDARATEALFASPANSLTWSLDGDGKSAKIIEVTKVAPPAMATASQSAKEVADTAKKGLSADMERVFLAAARQASDLEINEELWTTIRGSALTVR